MNAATQTVTPQFDQTTELKEMKFRFKKDKLGNQRQSLEFQVPVPSYTGIVAILEKGGKGLALLNEAIYDVVRSALASVVADNETISQDTIPFDKLSWEAIANMERQERKTIDETQWTGFAEDYVSIMPGVTGKSVEAVTNATLIYLKKFSLVKTRKDVLAKLKDQLALYIEHSPNAEQFSDVLDLLVNKADVYLKSDEAESLAANL